ncbi:hypothetical protein DYB32_004605 [Aphanomyces invadans]|uniref:Polycystin cation channel PKD1/PKD2 domain-containing protein n=1 Tax=Aphanomyces invadans TaxID=157072 RepID=A0A3R6YZE5_9STRA|nr:hypothetical protein DYB32_004605 [Aphanomyces invadans]
MHAEQEASKHELDKWEVYGEQSQAAFKKIEAKVSTLRRANETLTKSLHDAKQSNAALEASLQRAMANTATLQFLNSNDLEALEADLVNPAMIIAALKKANRFRMVQYEKVVQKLNAAKDEVNKLKAASTEMRSHGDVSSPRRKIAVKRPLAKPATMPAFNLHQSAMLETFQDVLPANMLRGIPTTKNGPPDAARLAQKMQHYSTMRVHMKRVQFALEEEKRNSFYKELLVYLLFLAIMMTTVCTLPIQVPFEHNDALAQAYLDQEFNNVSFKKNFYEVDGLDEMWQWFNDVLLDTYYHPTELNVRRISSVQIRSGRMQGLPCELVDTDTTLSLFPDELCYPAFSLQEEDTSPYFAHVPDQPKLITYEKDLSLLVRSLLFTPSIINARMNYGTDALVLPSTRYVAATWALYNPSSAVFTHIQVMFEISSTDHIELTQRLMSFRVLGYRNVMAFLSLENILMLFLAVVTVMFTVREVQSCSVMGLHKYTESMWNAVDMLQLGCLYALVFTWFRYLYLCHDIIPTLERIVRHRTCSTIDSGRDCFVDMGHIGLVVQDVTNMSACVALVSVAIVFKYLRLNTRLNMLWTTLRLAAKDLIAFVVIFVFIFFGYAVMGFLLFGTHVREYRSLTGSLASCFQMLLGAFDFTTLSEANPVMSGLFFFSFMIFVFLIVVNMFIAILSEYYSIAQDEKRSAEAARKDLLHANKAGGDTGDIVSRQKFDRIEYDVVNQLTKYWTDLTWRVRLTSKEPVPLTGGACVLLVDYSYLQAERSRLANKFRAAIRVIRICLAFIRPLRKFFEDFDASHVASSLFPKGKTRSTLRSKSSHHLDYRKFPVVYVPLYSKAANPLTMIDQLKPGDHLELDDGSLTFDRIYLQVMGDQDLYLADGVADPSTLRTEFGLHHAHPAVGGSGSHIKCCRVVYQGEIILAGHETCVVPKRIWVKYFASTVWRSIRQVFSVSYWLTQPKKGRNFVISDDDIAQLLEAQLSNDQGRGHSCRFDELVRQFRLFLAKKARQGTIRVPHHDLETCVKREAIAFVERFDKALLPLDARELNGYKYTPAPTDTSTIRLPNSIARLSEFLAHNAHEVWSQGRIAQGWRYGPQRDNELKLHPDLVAYDQLSEGAKAYDRDTSIEALKVIQALGYVMHPNHHSSSGSGGGGLPSSSSMEQSTRRMFSSQSSSFMDIDVDFGVAVADGETYKPQPIMTDDITLSPELNSLVELLAENTHDVWAKKRMEEGWVYGPKRNDMKKEHDGLVPYVYLTSDEKDMDRNTAVQTIKCILRCGFTITHGKHPGNGTAKFKYMWMSIDGSSYLRVDCLGGRKMFRCRTWKMPRRSR